MNHNDRIKAGVIGLGVGCRHLETLISHPGCEIKAVCDFNPRVLAESSMRSPTIATIKDADQLINDTEIDLIIIASYDNYHYHHVIESLKNGKHVFVEKPLCLFQEEAAHIRQVLRQHPDLHLSSNLALRTCPLFISLKEKIQSGQMGDVYSINGQYLWGRTERLLHGWRKHLEFYSLTHGAAIHLIDLIMWLTGQKPFEVQAYASRLATRQTDFKFNSFISGLLNFNGGLIAHVDAHGACVHPHFHQLQVFGSQATFSHHIGESEWISADVVNKDFDRRKCEEPYPAKELRSQCLLGFVDFLLGQRSSPPVEPQEVFDVMSVCFAIEKALAQHQPIAVEFFN